MSYFDLTCSLGLHTCNHIFGSLKVEYVFAFCNSRENIAVQSSPYSKPNAELYDLGVIMIELKVIVSIGYGMFFLRGIALAE